MLLQSCDLPCTSTLVGIRFYCICLFPCLFVHLQFKMKIKRKECFLVDLSRSTAGKCDISPASSNQDSSNPEGSLPAQQYRSWGYLSLWFKWGPSCGGGWIRLWLRHHRSLSLPSRASLQTSGTPRALHMSCVQPLEHQTYFAWEIILIKNIMSGELLRSNDTRFTPKGNVCNV